MNKWHGGEKNPPTQLKDLDPNLTGNVLAHKKKKRSQGTFSHPYKYLLSTNSKKKQQTRCYLASIFQWGLVWSTGDTDSICGCTTNTTHRQVTPALYCGDTHGPHGTPAAGSWGAPAPTSGCSSLACASPHHGQAVEPEDWHHFHVQKPHRSSELCQDFGCCLYQAEPWACRSSPHYSPSTLHPLIRHRTLHTDVDTNASCLHTVLMSCAKCESSTQNSQQIFRFFLMQVKIASELRQGKARDFSKFQLHYMCKRSRYVMMCKYIWGRWNAIQLVKIKSSGTVIWVAPIKHLSYFVALESLSELCWI